MAGSTEEFHERDFYDATLIDAEQENKSKTKKHSGKVDERATYVEESMRRYSGQFASQKGTRLCCSRRDQSRDVPSRRDHPG